MNNVFVELIFKLIKKPESPRTLNVSRDINVFFRLKAKIASDMCLYTYKVDYLHHYKRKVALATIQTIIIG